MFIEAVHAGALGKLLRLKGILWLATRHNTQAHAALAGTQFTLAPGPPWWASTPKEEWPAALKAEIDELWHAEHGDRQVELVCIGQGLDHAAAQAELEACLLTEAEMAAGPESWLALRDPFFEAWDAKQRAAEQRQELGKRVKKLQKALRKIDELKQKREAGKVLEKTQEEKIVRESELRVELAQLATMEWMMATGA